VGSVLLAVAVGADLVTAADLAAAGAAAGAGVLAAGAGVLAAEVAVRAAGVAAGAAGAGAVAAAAGVLFEAFWTPPWPLHAPLPVAEDVVPSLHVVGSVESAAQAGSAKAQIIKGAAMNPRKLVFFMKAHSLVLF
jgi:hypothetical protein